MPSDAIIQRRMLKKLLGKIHRADMDYQMIQDHDRIAVGVSGGKDSIFLLYALFLYRNFARLHAHKYFEVVGIHLDMGFPAMDFQPLNAFAHKHDIEFHHVPTRIYSILKQYPTNNGRLSCARCSQLKKGAMIKAAKELHCTKTSFAHHADDALETLFMNMIYGGRIATFAPTMYLERSAMTFIRPLIYCYEKEIREAIAECSLPVISSTCPNEEHTARGEVKAALQNLYDKFPDARHNFLLALHNIDQVRLFKKD